MCSADVSILLSNQYVDNYVPQQQLDGCSMTRPFLSAKGVACETTPGSPPECLKAVKQKWHAQAETTIKFRKYVLQQEYDDPSVFRFSKKKQEAIPSISINGKPCQVG